MDIRSHERQTFRKMIVDREVLYAELERAPEDWSVRLRLIEAAVALGDREEAKRLVRSSPDDDRYLPAELQDRIHGLLTSRFGGPDAGEAQDLESRNEE